MPAKNPSEKVTPAQKRKLHVAVVKRMVNLITAAFGLVAALAWNNVIQEFVNTYVKRYLEFGSGVISLLIYAFLITILAVVVTYQLTKIVERIEQS